MNQLKVNFQMSFLCLVAISLLLLIETTTAIKCYKCKGDDECDFTKRVIYVENCTWATKCWGARIGDHFIRGCADDRCDIQIGVGSYIESKCCYTELCNNENFFFPNSSNKLKKSKLVEYILFILSIKYLIKNYLL